MSEYVAHKHFPTWAHTAKLLMQIIPQRFMPYHAKNYGEREQLWRRYALSLCVVWLHWWEFVNSFDFLHIAPCVPFSTSPLTLIHSLSAFHCIVIAIASNVESSRFRCVKLSFLRGHTKYVYAWIVVHINGCIYAHPFSSSTSMALQVEPAAAATTANAVVMAVETLTTMNTMAIIVTCGYSVLTIFSTPVLFFATNSSFRLDFRLKECIQLRLKFLEF